jgi:hypothetical protein
MAETEASEFNVVPFRVLLVSSIIFTAFSDRDSAIVHTRCARKAGDGRRLRKLVAGKGHGPEGASRRCRGC